MNKSDFIKQVERFENMLLELDQSFQEIAQKQYTPQEIQQVRRTLKMFKLILTAGGFDMVFEVRHADN